MVTEFLVFGSCDDKHCVLWPFIFKARFHSDAKPSHILQVIYTFILVYKVYQLKFSKTSKNRWSKSWMLRYNVMSDIMDKETINYLS